VWRQFESVRLGLERPSPVDALVHRHPGHGGEPDGADTPDDEGWYEISKAAW
jgi:hypothetical protein